MLLLSERTPYPNDSVSKKNNIVKLPSKILTTEQTIILNKGLSFCPSKTKIDEIKFCQDNEKFIRNVRLMEIKIATNIPLRKIPLLKPQSNNLTPPSGRNAHVDTFVDRARKQCNNFFSNNNPTQTSNISEKHSRNTLAKDNSITIKEAFI